MALLLAVQMQMCICDIMRATCSDCHQCGHYSFAHTAVLFCLIHQQHVLKTRKTVQAHTRAVSKAAHRLCVLQALKKAFSDGNFTWQRPDSRPAPASALGDGMASNWLLSMVIKLNA